MRKVTSLLLNIVVIIGLTAGGGLLSALAVASQSGPGVVAPVQAVSAAPGRAHNKGQHKHKQKHKDRKGDRKNKDRKQKRHDQRNKHQQQGQPVELPTGVLPGAGTADPDVDSGEISAADHYIVLLKSGVGKADALSAASDVAAGKPGVTPTFVYHNVFEGFAAVIPPDQLDAVRNDPRVAAVEPDGLVTIDAQTIPTGIRRSHADQNGTADIDGVDERVNADVAVLDTAGRGMPADINQHAWANCTSSHVNTDDNGHGTHVSGTIGAIDNGSGVVGVAPGVRIWNIRVLVNGSGLRSWIICGLDLVALYATDQGDGLGDIEVANLSLGGTGTDSTCAGDLYHQAFCDVVAAGVTVAVAAGNSHANAAGFVPATYEEVITVSALADSDGLPGALGPATSRGPDDSLATFSNFGADVDIAAPGVDILSTVPTGSCEICDPTGFMSISGTSMASPHVAGAAALYLATHPTATPAQVKTALLNARDTVALPADPDGINEGVLNVSPASGFGAASAERTRAEPSARGADHKATRKHAHQQRQRHHKHKSKR